MKKSLKQFLAPLFVLILMTGCMNNTDEPVEEDQINEEQMMYDQDDGLDFR